MLVREEFLLILMKTRVLVERAETIMKRIQSYTAPGIKVTFDPDICIHSAVCLTSLPAVFDVRRSRWVQPEAATIAEVAAAIDRCPSGALKYVLEGQSEAATEISGVTNNKNVL